MGIRFYCSHCRQKLNVKVFQGGRQGLCPYCGGSIRIPTESTRPSSKEQRGSPSGLRPDNRDLGAARPGLPAQPLGEPSAAAASPMADSSPITPSAPSAPETPVAPANPITPDNPITMSVPEQPAKPVGHTPVASSQPVAYPSPLESPVASGPIDSAAPAGGDLASRASAPGTTMGQAPPVPLGTLDPLDEAPDAVWYVRPPGGGQFGPAACDIMRGWIDDGRVTPDSLVWREGWRDWQEASNVFTQLGAQQAAPGLGGIGTSQTSSAGVADSGHGPPTRRRPTALNAAIIAVLVLAIVALSVVFIWIVLG